MFNPTEPIGFAAVVLAVGQRDKSEPLDVLVWFSLLSLALLVLAYLFYQARRWLLVQKQQESPETWMGEFRRLRMDGELSEEEFARIRAVMAQRTAETKADAAVETQIEKTTGPQNDSPGADASSRAPGLTDAHEASN